MYINFYETRQMAGIQMQAFYLFPSSLMFIESKKMVYWNIQKIILCLKTFLVLEIKQEYHNHKEPQKLISIS